MQKLVNKIALITGVTEQRGVRRRSGIGLALGLALAGAVSSLPASAQTDSRIADLVQAGKLRVGLGVVAAHWAIKDPATGELRGVAVDLGRALAARIGVEFVPVEYPSPPKILDGLKTSAWDVGFLGVDPSRAGMVDFSPPYLQIDATYLVPAGSSIHNLADADKPGTRIAVAAKSVEEIVLKRTVKEAELRAVDTLPAGLELLRAGGVDVLAAPRPTVLLFSGRLAGSRVLDEPFNATLAALVVPKGNAARLAYIGEFIEQAKALGLIKQAIEHAGVHGVQELPPGSTAAH